MHLTIIYPVDPNEYSTHLRMKLHDLFWKLGLKPIIFNPHESIDTWTTLQINEPAPSEKLVDTIQIK